MSEGFVNFSGFECSQWLTYDIFRFQTQQDDIPFLPVLSGKAAANVNISHRRGVWGNRVSPTPTRWEGLGGLRPPKNYFHPAGVRRSRMDG